MTTPAPDPPLEAAGTVVLNASGYGTVTLTPPSFRTWRVTGINVRTSQTTTQTPVPQVTVYRGSVGGEIVAQTWMGNRATAVGDLWVQPSQPLIIEWTGGISGTTASVWLNGTISMR